MVAKASKREPVRAGPRAEPSLAGIGSRFWAASPPAEPGVAADSSPAGGPPPLPSRASRAEEIIVPLSAPRDQLGPVTHLRSTLVITSLKALRDRGHAARYFALLPPEHHDAIRSCIAGVWLPIELALAHYDACEALGISREEQTEVGREVGLKIQGTFLGTVVKLAKASGVTPWLAMTQYQRLWDRVFVGGGVTVTKLGPKEARLEFVELELARIPYFRTAFGGVNEACTELFCAKAYVEEVRKLCTPTSLGFRIAWA